MGGIPMEQTLIVFGKQKRKPEELPIAKLAKSLYGLCYEYGGQWFGSGQADWL